MANYLLLSVTVESDVSKDGSQIDLTKAHHFLGTVSGLYLSYLIFHSSFSLQRAHSPANTIVAASFAFFPLWQCRPALKAVWFWCFCPFFLLSPFLKLMIRLAQVVITMLARVVNSLCNVTQRVNACHNNKSQSMLKPLAFTIRNRSSKIRNSS